MKYLVISDIHGYENWLKKALEFFEKEKCDKLISLGDCLYHGPRNPFGNGYNPMGCVELLKPYLNKMIKIRGNCEADIDEELLGRGFENFYTLESGNKKFLLTHGHLLNENDLFLLKENVDYIVMGHFHIQKNYEINDQHFLSPGSISLPKQNSKHGVMIIEDGMFKTYDLETFLEV